MAYSGREMCGYVKLGEIRGALEKKEVAGQNALEAKDETLCS